MSERKPGPGNDEIRETLHAAADWAADYLAGVERYPVLARVSPGEIAAGLPDSPPELGEPMERLLADFERIVLPGITHWNHPGFFAYFGISGSGPGVVAELLAAALNVNAMLWRTSPAATELEQRCLTWVAQLLGLPAGWFGEICDTASSATHWALAAAREHADLDIRELGMAGRGDLPPLAIYASAEAHSSVDKAAIALGFGLHHVRRVAVDEAFRLRPDALREAVVRDLSDGLRPVAVVATVGTTSSTSIDPVEPIADICEEHGLWLHVDAAYGGSAAVVPSHRHVLGGCERADSLVVNPHKWLLTPIDCSLLYTRRKESLSRAFSLVPDYLATDDGDVVNLMDYGLSLGRRFRALKLWFVIRAYGRQGLADILGGHIRMASWLADRIREAPGWELMAPVPFSTICFRHLPAGAGNPENHNRAIVERVNRGGEIFLSSTTLGGVFAIRLAIGNLATEPRHVERAWELLQEAAAP